MKKAPIPINESERLAKLQSYKILDTEPEEKFDKITNAAAALCDASISLISLIDHNRQWFKSRYGLDAHETARDISYCGHAIMNDEVLIVEDAHKDPRFQDNPLLLARPHVVFYAGAPLITPDGFRIGTLCVIDSKPGQLTVNQIKILKTLANSVVELFELQIRNYELQKIKQQYQDVQQMVQAGAWELDIESEQTDWSDQIYEIYQIPKGTPTNKIDGISFYAKHEREKLSALISRCITEHKYFDDVFEFYDARGTKKWVRSIGRPIIENEQVVKVIGTFQDVTFQVEKSKEFEYILDNISEGYFDWHIPRDYEYMSAQFWQMLGYDPKDKKHHPSEWMNILHPEDLPRALTMHQHHVESKGQEPYELDVRMKNSSGQWVWVSVRGKIVEWDQQGQPLRMIGTGFNIHQQKLLNQENKMIKEGLDIYAIIARTDALGKIEYVNERFCEISGYSREELIGQDHRILNSGYHGKEFFSQMWQTIKSKNSWSGEIKNKAKDGSFYWVDTTIIPYIGVGGDITGYMAFRYDITAKKLLNEELIESQQRLDLAIEGASLGIWDWDLRDNSVNFDQRWAAMLGLDVKEIKMELATWQSRVHPDDLASCFEDIKKYLDGKTEYYENIHRMQHNSGHWVYILDRGRISGWDEQGKAIRFTGTHLDVTELMESKEEIKRYSNKLDTLFQFSPIVVYECLIDADWTMVFINLQIEKLSGYSVQEFLDKNSGITFAKIIHPDDRSFVNDGIMTASEAHQDYDLRYRIIDRSGQIRWVWERGRKSPESHHLIGVIIDITQQKRDEEISNAISNLRSKFIGLAHNSDIFLNYLLHSFIKLTDAQSGAICEVRSDKILDNFSRNIAAQVGSIDRDILEQTCQECFNAGEMHYQLYEQQDYFAFPIHYINKLLAIVILVGRKSSAKLDPSVYNRYLEASGEMIYALQINQELEQQKQIMNHQARLASLGEVAAGVGHEINNPLTIIRGQTQLMAEHLKKKNNFDQEVEGKIQKVLNSTKRIESIVKGLRNFSRSDHREMKIFNLSHLLKETIEMLEEIYHSDNIEFIYQINSNLFLLGNQIQIQQVLVNLLNNARDAVLKIERKYISLEAYERNKEIILTITDSGIGVPLDLKDKIFDPFFTTKEINKGTGIGLSLVSKIVKEHLGTIELDSNYNEGAKFILTFPSEKDLSAGDQIKDKSSISRQETGTILLVDDEPDILEILADQLSELGFNVLTASNGQEALAVLEQSSKEIKIILSDIQMPILNGIELAKNLRQKQGYEGKIYFMTGGVNRDQSNFHDFIDGIISKPFTQEEISKILGSF